MADFVDIPYAISLDEVKAHLRITGSDEDALLTRYAAAACEYVYGQVGSRMSISHAATAAILLLVGDLYENREAQAEKVLSANETVDRLLAPLRQWC